MPEESASHHMEHEIVKSRPRPDFYRADRFQLDPALVLLFELELYSSCSTSYLQLAVNRQPGYRQGNS